MSTSASKNILWFIVLSQFCCTSIWFATNGVMAALLTDFDLPLQNLGHLTAAVQLGFISGTLIYALFMLADRFSPSRVFMWSAVLGAICNAHPVLEQQSFAGLLGFRFLTGFFLAGIYPVGMKIAADYFDQKLGKSLGYLVGALVLGTALPHLLRAWGPDFPWQYVILGTSGLCVSGGLVVGLLIPDGPFRKPSRQLDFSAIAKVFRDKKFKAAALGYFGHMWELYAFWAFVPWILTHLSGSQAQGNLNISFWSFLIIGLGGLACVFGGHLSLRFGPRPIAGAALLSSALCGLISPLVFGSASPIVLLLFLVFWGMVVIPDSPLFSTLVARNSAAAYRGSALTIVNCIGFAITILSLELLTLLSEILQPQLLFLPLTIGPILGLIAFFRRSG